MRSALKRVVFATSLIITAAAASAATIGGVDLADGSTAGGQKLVLNGAGLRKKLFIKVYAAGLYL